MKKSKSNCKNSCNSTYIILIWLRNKGCRYTVEMNFHFLETVSAGVLSSYTDHEQCSNFRAFPSRIKKPAYY